MNATSQDITDTSESKSDLKVNRAYLLDMNGNSADERSGGEKIASRWQEVYGPRLSQM